nr:MAG TPA: hypothetical protein [Caudoviricetes sp.]
MMKIKCFEKPSIYQHFPYLRHFKKNTLTGSIPVSRSLKPLIFQGFFYFMLHFMLHRVISYYIFPP